MKNNDCLFSDIQNLCNAVSDWLIQKINNPIQTNETISCACCHVVYDTAEPVNWSTWLFKYFSQSKFKLFLCEPQCMLRHTKTFMTVTFEIRD